MLSPRDIWNSGTPLVCVILVNALIGTLSPSIIFFFHHKRYLHAPKLVLSSKLHLLAKTISKFYL